MRSCSCCRLASDSCHAAILLRHEAMSCSCMHTRRTGTCTHTCTMNGTSSNSKPVGCMHHALILIAASIPAHAAYRNRTPPSQAPPAPQAPAPSSTPPACHTTSQHHVGVSIPTLAAQRASAAWVMALTPALCLAHPSEAPAAAARRPARSTALPGHAADAWSAAARSGRSAPGGRRQPQSGRPRLCGVGAAQARVGSQRVSRGCFKRRRLRPLVNA